MALAQPAHELARAPRQCLAPLLAVLCPGPTRMPQPLPVRLSRLSPSGHGRTVVSSQTIPAPRAQQQRQC